MELESSQSYANFRAWCPRKEVSIGVLHPIAWRYYDWGPRTYAEPVVCLHSLIGSAESFFQQLISLAPRGYRILAIQIPVYWTVAEFCDAFHAFLDTVPHQRIHLYGAGLGGFLAMHYAVRKPERVASLVLTHSFLSTGNLNLRIPYSAAVLRWLPDFLIRATMSAILPKGRVSRDMANAAEMAIGHTLSCSREVLASRLALSVTKSSVVNRVHIPDTSITLIDTLDRQQPALELSESTASSFPNARRAMLKTGGDFPYLAVPEDVNVHLIVHMRRHAADPMSNVSVPVPARPIVLPVATRRRRQEEARRAIDDEKQHLDRDEESEGGRRSKRSVEELQKAAQAMVAADERSKIERYAFEVGRLREFLPGKHDGYLATVLDANDGNLDVAISKALNEEYSDGYYDSVLRDAVNNTLANLQNIEEDGVSREEENENQQNGDTEDPELDTSIIPDTNADFHLSSTPPAATNDDDMEEDIVVSFRRRRLLGQDPLGEAEFFMKDSQPEEADGDGSDNEGVDKLTTEVDSLIAISPGPDAVEQDPYKDDMRTEDPLVDVKTRDSPNSAMSSVDLAASDKHLTPEQDGATGFEDISVGESERGEAEPGSGARRQRRPRRRSYPQGPDAIGAYVTSEKVGMRSRGPLVGRGPAPFSSAPVEGGLSGGEGWMRSPRLKEEETTRPALDDKTQISLSSGASLLDDNENPLGLPGTENEYGDRRFAREFSGNKSAGSTPTMPVRETIQSRSSPLASSEGEVVLGRNASYRADVSIAEADEWETFRRRERGLAGVIPSPAGPVERTLEKSLENADAAGNGESEEAARLREWRMSAQAASKSVHR